MKIAVSGKGGTGKTTISALLAYSFSKDKKNVFLIDCDPDANLGITLGLSPQLIEKIKPIMELKEIIKERTSITDTMYKMNPEVSDILEKFSVEKDGIKLLVLGQMKRGGEGCYCPENSFLRSLLSHLLLFRDEIVILDMPAGIEHLSRGTAMGIDYLLIITEPTPKSIQTTKKIINLAKDLEIKNKVIIANKVKQNYEFIKSEFPNLTCLKVSYNYKLDELSAELSGLPIYQHVPETLNEIEEIKKYLILHKSQS